jgi:hypothetical protein
VISVFPDGKNPADKTFGTPLPRGVPVRLKSARNLCANPLHWNEF